MTKHQLLHHLPAFLLIPLSVYKSDKPSVHMSRSPPIPRSLAHFPALKLSGTHHNCLFGGMQSSLLDAVTPMAICITVIYFWYFILSTSTTRIHTTEPT